MDTMQVNIVILGILVNSFGFCAICPDFVVCSTSEEKSSCREGTFYKSKTKVNGCCPGCVPLKDEHQDCQNSDECQRGLFCNSKNLCEKDPSQGCDYYKRNDKVWNKTRYWNPECLDDGSYAPRQCKGEKLAGKCFCVDLEGNRVFGENEWSKAGDMTCGCSRLMSNLRRKNVMASFHCDGTGNYEALQCEGGVCWCASPISGLPYEMLVPTEMMASLPCHKSVEGTQYYRKCDSELLGQERVKELLVNRGTRGIIFATPNCNFDGSYHRVQTFKDKKRCVSPNNEPLTEAVSSGNANCHCAYDRHVQVSRIPFLYDCLPNGNYAPRQFWNGKIFCIDSDGFVYSDDPADCSGNSER